jgi:hypothetical protein
MLHLLPGAVAVAAGLMIMTLSPVRRVSGVRSGLGLAALLLAASGAWFVIGPALWPTFQSSPAYATGTSAWTSFWNQLGANLGPGLLLAFFGGMVLKASVARPAVAVGEPASAGDGVETAETRDGMAAATERSAYDENAAATSQPRGTTRRGFLRRHRGSNGGETATTSQPAVSDQRRAADTGGPAPDVNR